MMLYHCRRRAVQTPTTHFGVSRDAIFSNSGIDASCESVRVERAARHVFARTADWAAIRHDFLLSGVGLGGGFGSQMGELKKKT